MGVFPISQKRIAVMSLFNGAEKDVPLKTTARESLTGLNPEAIRQLIDDADPCRCQRLLFLSSRSNCFAGIC